MRREREGNGEIGEEDVECQPGEGRLGRKKRKSRRVRVAARNQTRQPSAQRPSPHDTTAAELIT